MDDRHESISRAMLLIADGVRVVGLHHGDSRHKGLPKSVAELLSWSEAGMAKLASIAEEDAARLAAEKIDTEPKVVKL